jgi:hypothetical protein
VPLAGNAWDTFVEIVEDLWTLFSSATTLLWTAVGNIPYRNLSEGGSGRSPIAVRAAA